MTWLKIIIQTLTHLIGKKADKRDVEQLRRDTIPAPATASPGQTIVVKTVDDNGKPIEWEAGEAGGGMPEGGEPFQQLVTDADGVVKWEDRTHYSIPAYTSLIPVMPEIAMQFEEANEYYGVPGYNYNEVEGYTISNSRSLYTVIWDGVTYSDLVVTEWPTRYWANTIGKQPPSEDVPFFIEDRHLDGGVLVKAFTAGEHTFSVYEQQTIPETVKTFDPKYLPKNNFTLDSRMTKGDCLFSLATVSNGHTHSPDESKLQDEGSLAAVYYNGELYVCQYKYQSVSNRQVFNYWGNLFLYNGNYADTGEPFCYIYDSFGDAFYILGKDESFSFEVYACEVIRIPSAMVDYDQSIILRSSSAQSKKRFEITVDDSGTITATEVT